MAESTRLFGDREMTDTQANTHSCKICGESLSEEAGGHPGFICGDCEEEE